MNRDKIGYVIGFLLAVGLMWILIARGGEETPTKVSGFEAAPKSAGMAMCVCSACESFRATTASLAKAAEPDEIDFNNVVAAGEVVFATEAPVVELNDFLSIITDFASYSGKITFSFTDIEDFKAYCTGIEVEIGDKSKKFTVEEFVRKLGFDPNKND